MSLGGSEGVSHLPEGGSSPREVEEKPVRVLCLPGEFKERRPAPDDDLRREITLEDCKRRTNEVLDDK